MKRRKRRGSAREGERKADVRRKLKVCILGVKYKGRMASVWVGSRMEKKKNAKIKIELSGGEYSQPC